MYIRTSGKTSLLPGDAKMDIQSALKSQYHAALKTLRLTIRHIQHHASALSSRLRRSAGIEIHWVGRA